MIEVKSGGDERLTLKLFANDSSGIRTASINDVVTDSERITNISWNQSHGDNST